MQKKTKYIIGFWFVFMVLFIIGHIILSKIIVYYQQRPAIETAEAYEVLQQHQQQLVTFYQVNGYCPRMADKDKILGTPKAYHYVESIRLLQDKTSTTCFIAAVMRLDTPSQSVKGKTVVVGYNPLKPESWECYTDIEDKHVVSACFNHPLPIAFKQALSSYLRELPPDD